MDVKPVIYVVILVILAVCAYSFLTSDGGGFGKKNNAISGLSEPKQTKLSKSDGTGKQVEIKDIKMDVTYKYKYEVDALVVSAKSYKGYSIQDTICPKDIAFAWGDVAAHNSDIDFHWSQSGRFCYWELDSYDDAATLGGVNAIIPQISNNHIIPADTTVKDDLKKVKTGDHIRLEGYLVDIVGTDKDGTTFTWSSSTSRDDTGNGACEVIYTTKIEWVP